MHKSARGVQIILLEKQDLVLNEIERDLEWEQQNDQAGEDLLNDWIVKGNTQEGGPPKVVEANAARRRNKEQIRASDQAGEQM